MEENKSLLEESECTDSRSSIVYDRRGDKSPGNNTANGLLLSITILFLTLSSILNVVLLAILRKGDQPIFADQSRPISRPFGIQTPYSGPNMSLADELWAAIDPNVGMIALPKNIALQDTETFPWDSSKGVYMLNGHHSLHCLQYNYQLLRDVGRGQPLSLSVDHAIHCLDTLRLDVLCEADDTPRAAGFRHVSEDNAVQWKNCRDWGRLDEYAVANSACFRRLEGEERGTLEEWKWCPEGSKYKDVIKRFEDSGVKGIKAGSEAHGCETDSEQEAV